MNTVRIVFISLLAVSSQVAAQTTGAAGGNQPIQLGQPSLGLTQVIATAGTFPSANAGQSSMATMHIFGFPFAPNNAPRAEGQLLTVQSSAALYSLLGATYGGNGTQTFGLPDLRGRFLVGNGAGPGLSPRAIGEMFGRTSTLMSPAMPLHFHVMADGTRTTGVSGGGGSIDIHAPTLAMNAFIMTEGIFPSPGSGVQHPFLGEIRWYAGTRVPDNAVPCDGRLLQITAYEALYAVVGTTFGGDGVNTFAVPDLRGRVAVGTGQGPGLASVTLGQTWGSPTVTLTLAQLPSHLHAVPGEGVTQMTGNSLPVQLIQPSLGVTWLVATNGVYPTQSSGNGSFDDEPTMGELVAFAGNFAPRGFALANGATVSIAQNQALFSLFGTNFGGNGTNTFNLPDLRGRTPIGAGGSSTLVIGQPSGWPTQTLLSPHLTTHMHSYVPVPVVVDAGVPDAGVDAGVVVDAGVADAGFDAGVVVDAGIADAGFDAGVVVDAGVEFDAGIELDAGVEEDAGVEVDAGTEEDAGTQVDAGIEEDAGVLVDAGTSEEDAGVIADAGTQVRDAGMQVTDGGDEMPIDPMEPGGCGCTTNSGSAVLFGALAMFLRTRRRR